MEQSRAGCNTVDVTAAMASTTGPRYWKCTFTNFNVRQRTAPAPAGPQARRYAAAADDWSAGRSPFGIEATYLSRLLQLLSQRHILLSMTVIYCVCTAVRRLPPPPRTFNIASTPLSRDAISSLFCGGEVGNHGTAGAVAVPGYVRWPAPPVDSGSVRAACDSVSPAPVPASMPSHSLVQGALVDQQVLQAAVISIQQSASTHAHTEHSATKWHDIEAWAASARCLPAAASRLGTW